MSHTHSCFKFLSLSWWHYLGRLQSRLLETDFESYHMTPAFSLLLGFPHCDVRNLCHTMPDPGTPDRSPLKQGSKLNPSHWKMLLPQQRKTQQHNWLHDRNLRPPVPEARNLKSNCQQSWLIIKTVMELIQAPLLIEGLLLPFLQPSDSPNISKLPLLTRTPFRLD